MKRVAIVGFGFMGKAHCGAWKKCRGAKVTAVCDSNLAQLTAKVTGNIKGAADNSTLPDSVRVFDDFNAMLAAGGFDIVDITLPTPLHPDRMNTGRRQYPHRWAHRGQTISVSVTVLSQR